MTIYIDKTKNTTSLAINIKENVWAVASYNTYVEKFAINSCLIYADFMEFSDTYKELTVQEKYANKELISRLLFAIEKELELYYKQGIARSTVTK